jgi:hypothetical protein
MASSLEDACVCTHRCPLVYARSKEKADEVLAFFASNPAPAAERKIRQSVETVRSRRRRRQQRARGGGGASHARSRNQICANAWRRHNVVRDPEWLAALTAVAL